MFWASTLVLLTVTSAVTPAAAAPAHAPSAAAVIAASTYDEASCATDGATNDDHPGEPSDLLAVEERDCQQPELAPTPTIIDCNDPGASFWVTEMIGSCDMPRTSPGAGPPMAVRAPRELTNRLCDGLRCLPDSSPLRPAGRLLDDGTPAVAEVLRLAHDFTSSPLYAAPLLSPSQADERRLERPPRAI